MWFSAGIQASHLCDFIRACEAQELDVNMFSVLVYPLRSKGKDGHSAAAHIVSG